MFVASVLVAPLIDVVEGTILIAKVVVVDAAYVIVHRYHSSRHGMIVDDMTPKLLPTWPVRRLKFTYTSMVKRNNCAKSLVPRRR